MSMKNLRQRITSANGINIPDADYLRVPAGEIRVALAEATELRRERDELAAKYDELLVALHGVGWAIGIEEADRSPYSIACGVLVMANKLAAIEAQEPVAWVEHELHGTGLRHLHFARRPNTLRDDVVAPVWTELIARPAPRQRVSRADELTPAAPSEQLASRPACDWPGKCKHQHQRPSQAAAPERAAPTDGCGDACRSRASCRPADESPRPADPRTPPPGCRLLGDYEPAQAGDMAYIGAIGGRWRRVRPRMGIIGATMDELSDGARVLALARPCRCPRGEQ